MARSAIRTALLAASLAMLLPGVASADDNLKIAKRGGWEQSVSELGQNKGFFKKHGLVLELLYTQGSAETLQSVISNSVDIGIGLGTHAMLGPRPGIHDAAEHEPLRISGLPGIMDDAVKFKYIPAPLSDAQLKEALPVDALK
jgi:NitT/TauT family transport system substrate-binding protein